MSKRNQLKKIAVLGAGSWGGTIAEHLAQLGHNVTVWHRNEEELKQMSEKRTHPFLDDLQFSRSIRFVESMDDLKKQYSLADTVLRNGDTFYICQKINDAEFEDIQ